MIQKQVLVPGRVRRPPADGWSWIDRRFLREHAARLSHEAIVLYFFLTAVSDKDGLSFYGDASIALRLRMGEAGMVAARDELVAADLVAYRAPLRRCSPCPPSGCSGVAAVWPPSARSSAAWPIPLTLPRNGDPHESRLVGGNPPFARDRRSLGAGHRPPFALLHQNRRQGFDADSAARSGSAGQGKHLRPLPRTDRCLAGQVSRSQRGTGGGGDRPRRKRVPVAASTPCGVTCIKPGPCGAGCIRRCSTSRARRCKSIGATAGG